MGTCCDPDELVLTHQDKGKKLTRLCNENKNLDSHHYPKTSGVMGVSLVIYIFYTHRLTV